MTEVVKLLNDYIVSKIDFSLPQTVKPIFYRCHICGRVKYDKFHTEVFNEKRRIIQEGIKNYCLDCQLD